jgi:hypothetical protein
MNNRCFGPSPGWGQAHLASENHARTKQYFKGLIPYYVSFHGWLTQLG